MKEGKVYLVGAGPGDPGLMTVKGAACLQQADVVIYDRLIDQSLLDLVRSDAEKIFAGKTAEYQAKEQAEINELLVKKARAGKTVVRLKGGDPFVLGRGGEEAEFLASNHITFDVVPGVSSAIAAPAYAGIPLTHRDLASSFLVVTGHEARDKTKPGIPWARLATSADTLVILMGIANLAKIATELIKNGRTPATPVALIHQGTTTQQHTLVGTLETIARIARKSKLGPPAVIVVGEVVRLRDQLRWFDNRPLFGKQILVSRATHQAGELSRRLRERGARPIAMPLLQIHPPASWAEVDKAIQNLSHYHWIIFTSVNGVEMFFQRVSALGLDARQFRGQRLGVIGPATAAALQCYGLRPDYMPREYTSRGFLAKLSRQDIADCRVLLPRADIASRELADGLTRLGAEIHEVTAYQTKVPAEIDSLGREILARGEIDIIIFTSSAMVTNLLTLLGTEWQTINQAKIACIGPKTAATATGAGLRVDIIAEEATIAGLVAALEKYFLEKGES